MRKFGVIGYPLEHSFSPAYFRQKFVDHQISNATYEAYPLPDLSTFRKWFIGQGLSGVNVTIPYKEEIISQLDGLDSLAESIGAVNCIALQNSKLIGYNTDADGFSRSIVPFLENKFERALIIGTGGSSKAVACALQRWGMDIFFLTRKPSLPNHLAYGDLTVANISFFPLIINCSPRGTFPDMEDCPDIPYQALTSSHFLYDLVYNPKVTKFLDRGKAQGAFVMNGLKMLEIQADLSWEIWNQTDTAK